MEFCNLCLHYSLCYLSRLLLCFTDCRIILSVERLSPFTSLNWTLSPCICWWQSVLLSFSCKGEGPPWPQGLVQPSGSLTHSSVPPLLPPLCETKRWWFCWHLQLPGELQAPGGILWQAPYRRLWLNIHEHSQWPEQSTLYWHNLTLFFIYTGRLGWSVMYVVSEKQTAPPLGCTRAGASAPAPRAPAALGTEWLHTWGAFDFLLRVSEQAAYRAPVIFNTRPNSQRHSLFYHGNRSACRSPEYSTQPAEHGLSLIKAVDPFWDCTLDAF